MTRAERRALRSQRRELRRLAAHPSVAARCYAREGLQHIEAIERLDPRPALRLRLKLRWAGVDIG
jgi:hypothetical protein